MCQVIKFTAYGSRKANRVLHRYRTAVSVSAVSSAGILLYNTLMKGDGVQRGVAIVLFIITLGYLWVVQSEQRYYKLQEYVETVDTLNMLMKLQGVVMVMGGLLLQFSTSPTISGYGMYNMIAGVLLYLYSFVMTEDAVEFVEKERGVMYEKMRKEKGECQEATANANGTADNSRVSGEDRAEYAESGEELGL